MSLNFYTPSMEQGNPLRTLLQEQTRQYQHHLSIRNKAQKALQYQTNIRTFRTIPKHFLPQKFPLTSNFCKSFEDLFFKHLDKVVTSNTITLELAESQLRNITQHTMKLLAESTESSTVIREHYQKFITDNNITNPEPYSKPLDHNSQNPTATNPSEETNTRSTKNQLSGKLKKDKK